MDGVKTEFFLNGTQILAQKTGSNTPMVFYYDHNGKRVAFKNTDGAVYFYVYNLQGDVVQLLDSSRNIVGEYQYDPYGRVQNTLSAIAKANPFRYRGYYFDSENGYYYLNARYYYPVFGRFISADEVAVSTLDNRALTEKNLFSYCNDNPVNRTDDGGYCAHVFVGALVGGAIGFFGSIISDKINKRDTDYNAAFAALAFGALGGALTAAGLPMVASVLVGAGIGAGAEAADQLIRYNEINNVSEIIIGGVTGGIGGALSGSGAMKDLHLDKYVKSQKVKFLNSIASGKPLTKAVKYTYKMTKTCYKLAAKYAAKKVLFSSGLSTGLCNITKRICEEK